MGKKKPRVNTSNFNGEVKTQATQVIQKLKLTNIIESPKEHDMSTKMNLKSMKTLNPRKDSMLMIGTEDSFFKSTEMAEND